MEFSKTVRGGAGPSTHHRPDDAMASGEVDYLEVAGHAAYEVPADAVSLTVRVEANALVADPSALQTVPALASLAQRLGQAGAGELSIATYEGRGRSGLLSSNTEARYHVCIECPVAHLAAVMLVIAQDKPSTLVEATWTFLPHEEAAKDAIVEAAKDARDKAQTLAGALGVALGAPHRVLHHYWAEDPSDRAVTYGSKAASLEDLYVRLAAKRTLHTKVILRYRMT